jgi:hypothetical protein
MAEVRLFVKDPDGALISRRTYHKYTHAVLVPREDAVGARCRGGSDTWRVWGWTTHPERMLREARAIYRRAIAVPVLP